MLHCWESFQFAAATPQMSHKFNNNNRLHMLETVHSSTIVSDASEHYLKDSAMCQYTTDIEASRGT